MSRGCILFAGERNVEFIGGPYFIVAQSYVNLLHSCRNAVHSTTYNGETGSSYKEHESCASFRFSCPSVALLAEFFMITC